MLVHVKQGKSYNLSQFILDFKGSPVIKLRQKWMQVEINNQNKTIGMNMNSRQRLALDMGDN